MVEQIKQGQSARILLIANTTWFLQNFCKGLVERLEEEGHEVALAAPPGEVVQYSFYQERRFFPIRLSRKGVNPLIELLAITRFVQLFYRLQPDVVLTWTPKPNIYGGIAGRILGMPVIQNISGMGAVFIGRNLLVRAVGLLYRLAVARAPVIYFLNEPDRELFINSGWIEPDRAIMLPGTGIDLDEFAVEPLPPPKPWVFLYIGRLLADKGLHELIESARCLQASGYSFELHLAGFVDRGNPHSITHKS